MGAARVGERVRAADDRAQLARGEAGVRPLGDSTTAPRRAAGARRRVYYQAARFSGPAARSGRSLLSIPRRILYISSCVNTWRGPRAA